MTNILLYLKKITFLFFLALMIGCSKPTTMQLDLLIQNANIIDGSGKTAYISDIGIIGDTIAFIGDEMNYIIEAKETINAEGFTLTPGFIDPHTHAFSDLNSPNEKRNHNLNYLYQGVTTVITGNDGGGPVKVGEALSRWEKQGIGTNAALLVGHGTVRKLVKGMSDSPVTEEELGNMRKLVIRAMKEGAFGMSTGLYYTPGNFANTDEVVELAKVVAQNGGIYDSHIRDESSYSIGLIGAVEETLEIGKRANIHLNFSHIKALGVDVWGKSVEVIRMIEEAQSKGVSISADQYPYRASGTRVSNAVVPRWAFAGDFQKNFNDPKLYPQILEEMKDNLRRRGGATSLLMTSRDKPEIQGLNLAEVAEKWSLNPLEAATRIINEGGSRVASFNMNEDDIHNFMREDWVMTSSDGSTGHPRKYGSYPKKIKEFVVEKNILPLEEMVRKSTSYPAKIFQIKNRGRVEVGYFADLLIFKPEDIKDNATFTEPEQLAEGINWVILNGKIALKDGKHVAEKYGRALKKG